jgi:hypothetical protein
MAQALTKRLPVTLSLATHGYLTDLAREGTYGPRPTDVAKSLIEEGIRHAIKDGLLTRKVSASANADLDKE